MDVVFLHRLFRVAYFTLTERKSQEGNPHSLAESPNNYCLLQQSKKKSPGDSTRIAGLLYTFLVISYKLRLA
jgi:hypothetical protein